jgi:hypothetical protein
MSLDKEKEELSQVAAFCQALFWVCVVKSLNQALCKAL